MKNYEFDFNFRQWGNCSVTMTSVLGHMTSLDFDQKYKSWKSCQPGQLFEAETVTTVDKDKKALADNLKQQARYARILFIATVKVSILVVKYAIRLRRAIRTSLSSELNSATPKERELERPRGDSRH